MKDSPSTQSSPDLLHLPAPRSSSGVPLEFALGTRRSIRHYEDEALGLEALAQLAWAAQGITDPEGLRTTPSAGALYPLELDVVVGNVEELPPGVYRYQPAKHSLVRRARGDVRRALARASLRQEPVHDAAVVLVLSAVYERTTGKYSTRGRRYVHMEVGHAAQNILLQAVALELGGVVIGAFDDEDVAQVMKLRRNERPLCLVPVGVPKS